MKNLFYLVLLAFMIVSCKNEEVQEIKKNVSNNNERTMVTLEDGTTATYKFYIDESEVDEILNPTNYLIAMSSKQTSRDSGLINVYAFSSRERYVNFGNRVNPKLVQSLLFEEKIQEYMSSRNLDIDTFEPDQAYLDFEKQTYEAIANGKKGTNAASLVVLYDSYFSGGGSSVIMPRTLPVMYPGWNNRVKSYTLLAIAGPMTMYDKAFYRKRLFTAFNWGFTSHSSVWAWNSFWDSKMTSGVTF